jgi:PTH1 family peptidyl-tRNA hydrolase
MLKRLFGRLDKTTSQSATLVAGLGNPGTKYAASRHNVGFRVLDRFTEVHGMHFDKMEFQGLLARGNLNGEEVLLVKPMSFMNKSGPVVKPIMSKYGVELQRLLVVYDDLDLPLGKVRVRSRGGSGGHRGMESIVTALGTGDFARLRIGIGRSRRLPPEEYVLREFSIDQSIEMEAAYETAVSAVECFIRRGIAHTMNQYN